MGQTFKYSLQSLASADRRLLTFEVVAVSVLVALAVWSMRPLLEEWGFFYAFNAVGLRYFVTSFEASPVRPLHVFPYWLQWAMSGGQHIGVGIACGLLMALRYLVVRWAVSPILPAPQRAIFALLCATCLGWQGLWFGRFSAAQISSILFFAALGFAIRLCFRARMRDMIAAGLCVFVFLLIYQAPLFVTALLPLIAFSGAWKNDPQTPPIKRFLLVGVPLLAGTILYIAYSLAAQKFIGPGYEANMMPHQLTLSQWRRNLLQTYHAAFIATPFALPLYTLALCAFAAHEARRSEWHLGRVGLLCLSILALPLLSLIYFYPMHTNDPERVLFPVYLGFCLLALAALSGQEGRASQPADNTIMALALPLMAWAAICAIEVRGYWKLQSYVLTATAKVIDGRKDQKILIVDQTGRLGDIYTLYDNTFHAALLVLGKKAEITICTPTEVDRLHPVARRFPVSTTARCEASTSADTILIAHEHKGKVRLRLQQ